MLKIIDSYSEGDYYRYIITKTYLFGILICTRKKIG